MKDNIFSCCPDCEGKQIQTLRGGRQWVCSECGFDLYNNVAAAVGMIIQNHEGLVLFEQRAKEPRKGFLALPGGFVDPDESLENAAFRECREELGLSLENIRYLCSFPNTYVYKNITYKTCDSFFTAMLPPNSIFRSQQSEVTSIAWKPVHSASDMEKLPIAFDSTKNALLQWLSQEKHK